MSGSVDGIGSVAKFKQPAGLTLDAAGNIYVAENGNSIIRKISSSGKKIHCFLNRCTWYHFFYLAGAVTRLAGLGTVGWSEGLGTVARFNLPQGITVDTSGNLFVADFDNQRIRKVTAAGMIRG